VSPLGTSATSWPLYQPRMMDDDEYGAVGGMRIGRGNRSTRRKHSPMPLCPPQIQHHLTWARTRAAAVGSRRLWHGLGREVKKNRYRSFFRIYLHSCVHECNLRRNVPPPLFAKTEFGGCWYKQSAEVE
jgi:hypothetical protein